MALDLPVGVTCPEDEGAGGAPVEAVLRIRDGELDLWVPYQHKQSERWLRWRTLRAFRGPWPVQFALTVFFAPIVLFGKGNVTWIATSNGPPRLRITPFVPAEFWLDIHFACNKDFEEAARRVDLLWAPTPIANRHTNPLLSLFRKWWRLWGLVVFVVGLTSSSCGADGADASLPPWIAAAAFGCHVVTVMVVEAVGHSREPPPRRPPAPGPLTPPRPPA